MGLGLLLLLLLPIASASPAVNIQPIDLTFAVPIIALIVVIVVRPALRGYAIFNSRAFQLGGQFIFSLLKAIGFDLRDYLIVGISPVIIYGIYAVSFWTSLRATNNCTF